MDPPLLSPPWVPSARAAGAGRRRGRCSGTAPRSTPCPRPATGWTISTSFRCPTATPAPTSLLTAAGRRRRARPTQGPRDRPSRAWSVPRPRRRARAERQLRQRSSPSCCAAWPTSSPGRAAATARACGRGLQKARRHGLRGGGRPGRGHLPHRRPRRRRGRRGCRRRAAATDLADVVACGRRRRACALTPPEQLAGTARGPASSTPAGPGSASSSTPWSPSSPASSRPGRRSAGDDRAGTATHPASTRRTSRRAGPGSEVAVPARRQPTSARSRVCTATRGPR